MRALLILFVMLAGPAGAGEYSLEKRPEVVFKGGYAHKTPYPQTRRSTSVWVSDACWRECSASCTWKMETCVRVGPGNADTCRPYLDACDRSCQRECRGPWAGPLVGFLDF